MGNQRQSTSIKFINHIEIISTIINHSDYQPYRANVLRGKNFSLEHRNGRNWEKKLSKLGKNCVLIKRNTCLVCYTRDGNNICFYLLVLVIVHEL